MGTAGDRFWAPADFQPDGRVNISLWHKCSDRHSFSELDMHRERSRGRERERERDIESAMQTFIPFKLTELTLQKLDGVLVASYCCS
jgi:hypothetical protein